MPRALKSSIHKQIAHRHRKMLVGTDIAQSGDLSIVAHEADRITGRSHPLENHPFGKIPERCNGLKSRIFVRSKLREPARCAHF
jgi:hypothetical protein